MGVGAAMSVTRIASVVVSLALLAGCIAGGGEREPSRVAQGLAFSAGNREYDDFFSRVHRLQLEMAHAPSDFTGARSKLADSVVLPKTSSDSVLAAQVKVELERLNKRGVAVRVEFKRSLPATAEGTRAVFTPASKPNAADTKLVEALESSVTTALQVSTSMRAAREELPKLCAKAEQLEASLDANFPNRFGSRRAEVIANLRDAERVLALMIARADETGKPADHLVAELSVALGKESKVRAPDDDDSVPARSVAVTPAAAPAGEPASAAAKTPGAEKPATPKAANAEPVTRSAFEP
jgi:hypothetical protein